MKNPCKQALVTVTVALAVLIPNLVSADATSVTGAGTLTTDAHVDFRITIPRILRFRVGSPAGTIDLIDIAPTSAVLGGGTDVAATGGDLGGGDVTVNVLSNAGDVTITHDTNGASLTDGTNTIPYTEILTASNAVLLPAPGLGTATSSTVVATAGLTNESAVWTYTYDNSVLYPDGIYGGVNTNGGRVTYTATSP